MTRYRTKPTEVEAFKVSDLLESNWIHLPVIIREAHEAGLIVFRPDSVGIRRLDGVISVERPDWILHAEWGCFFPCTAEDFAKKFEPIEDSE